MNRLSFDTQTKIVALLAEGNSLRATSRLLGITLNSVSRNMVWLGEGAQRFHDATVHGLKSTRLEADECWSFLNGKEDSLPAELRGHPDFGTCWTWVSIDPDSKIIPNWYIGKHEASDAAIFINDLARRIPGRLQLTTDQLMHYRTVIEEAFGDRVDYATIRKDFNNPTLTPDGKFEPVKHKAERRASVYGNPDKDLVTTSSIESQNTRLRLWNKRYNRNTIAFSRRLRNMRASLAIHFCYYNFCRIPKAIRCTPAMEAGLTDHIWEVEELVEKIKTCEVRDVGYLNRKAA
jgi:IS1 family transposase